MSLWGLLTMGLLASCNKDNDSSKEYKRNYTETELGLNMQMVYVEGGSFEMGATAEQEEGARSNEYPVRTVKLDSYYIGKYEVTQAQWETVMGTNPSYFTGDDKRPVERVSWNEAQEFCRRLSEATGKRYMLPTEAQWEYAARGGKKSKGYKYSGSDDIEEVAWYGENSDYQTHRVGTKKANELGIYDMSGNIFEWCSDWYGTYDESDTDNPQGPVNGSNRVYRGGSWYHRYAFPCRVAFRISDSPDFSYYFLGFRVVCLP